MPPAPLPADETERLDFLRHLDILDTAPEARFDRLVGLVHKLLDVPIATLTFVDADRQWFKARIGLDVCETPRDVAFCAHAILDDAPTVVEDARLDPRFADSPLVTRDGIRFYAGVPLPGRDGAAIGVLCAVDTTPRSLAPAELDLLRELAELAADELALRQAYRELDRHHARERASSERLQGFLATASDWMWETDTAHRFTFHSHWGDAIRPHDEVIGRTRWELAGADPDCEPWCDFRATLDAARPFRAFRYALTRSDGRVAHLEITGAPRFDEAGTFLGHRGCGREVTALVEAETGLRALGARHAALENANVLGFFWGEGDVVAGANDALLRMLGHDRDALAAGRLRWREMTPPEWAEADAAAAADLVRSGQCGPYDKEFWRADGGRLPITITAVLLDATRFAWQVVVQDRSAWQAAEARMRELSRRLETLEDANVLAVVTGEDDRYVSANDAFLDMIGRTRAELEAGRLSWRELTPPEWAAATAGIVDQLHREGRSQPTEKELWHAAGHRVPILVTVVRLDGAPFRWQSVILDLTARKAAEARMHELGLRLEALERSPTIGVLTGEGWRITSVNDAMLALLGYARAEFEARGFSVPDLTPAEWHEADDAILAGLVTTGTCAPFERELFRKDGTRAPVRLTPVLIDAERLTWQCLIQDIAEQKANEARIADLAFRDALTRLPNRRCFNERLVDMLEGDRGAVIFVDLDHFKDVNDAFGHDAGDALLVAVARRLEATTRAGDLVARLGGDEFALVLRGRPRHTELVQICERILATLQEPVIHKGIEIYPGGSLGVTRFPEDGRQRDRILKNADVALYRAKATGRRTYRFFEPAMQDEARARLALAAEIRRALVEAEFGVVFQPVLELASGRHRGFEALLRWHHPTRGTLGPDVFLPAAEEAGLVPALGTVVLETVTRQMASWLEAGLEPGVVAVNITAGQLRDPAFTAAIEALLHAHGLTPGRLELEITEDVLLAEDARVEATIHDLGGAGLSLALDDFGTGFASLTHLKRFPVDVLKIDRSFVAEVATVAESALIAKAIVSLAHSLAMRVVAEGIEEPAQLEVLRHMACDFGQGYLFARPASGAATTPWLEGRAGYGRPAAESAGRTLVAQS